MRGRRSRAQTPRAALNAFKSRVNGHTNTLRAMDAPPLAERIYYQQVIRLEVTEATNFTPASICQALAAQVFPVSLATDTDLLSSLVIKLERVDVWATAVASTAARPACTLTCYSTDTNSSSQGVIVPILKVIKDIGTLSAAARTSYTWPLDMVETPLSFRSDLNVASVVFNTESAEVRFHLRWSPIGALIVA